MSLPKIDDAAPKKEGNKQTGHNKTRNVSQRSKDDDSNARFMLDKIQSQTRRLQSKFETQDQENSELQEQVAIHEEGVKQLTRLLTEKQKALTVKDDQIKKKEELVDRKDKAIKDCEKKITKTMNELTVEKKAVMAKNKEISRYAQDLAKTKEIVILTEKKKEHESAKSKKFEAKLRSAEAQLTRKEEELGRWRPKLEAQKTLITQMDASITANTKQLTRVRELLKESEARETRKAAEIKKHKITIHSTRRQLEYLSDVQSQKEALAKAYHSYKAVTQVTVTKLRSELRSRVDENHELTRKWKMYADQVELRDRTIEAQAKEIVKQKKTVVNLEDFKAKANERCKILEQELEGKNLVIGKNTKVILDQLDRMSMNKEVLATKVSEIEELKAELMDTRSKISGLIMTVQSRENSIKEHKASYATQQGRLNNVNQEKTQLDKTLHERNHQLEEQRMMIDRQAHEIADKEAVLKLKTVAIEQHVEQVATQKANIEILEAQVAALRQEKAAGEQTLQRSQEKVMELEISVEHQLGDIAQKDKLCDELLQSNDALSLKVEELREVTEADLDAMNVQFMTGNADMDRSGANESANLAFDEPIAEESWRQQ